MQFFTVREANEGEHHTRRQFGGRAFYGPFRFRVAPDPRVEQITVDALAAPNALNFWAVERFLPYIALGVTAGVDFSAKSLRKRFCGIRLTIRDQGYHEVATHHEVMRGQGFSFVASTLERHAVTIEPLHAEWLTSDVVALARGIHADAAFDRLPILSDALQDAGCEDQLIREHLQICPDHGPSCWVVEMILDQMRTAGLNPAAH